jgi:ribosomal protein S13
MIMITIKQLLVSSTNHLYCTSIFKIPYGIGQIHASRLSCFHLNHPGQRGLIKAFDQIWGGEIIRNLPHTLLLDRTLRLTIGYHLRDKICSFTYPAFRLFQGLPTRGQRSRSNAMGIKNVNPFLSLKIKSPFYEIYSIIYKRKELLFNGRKDELKLYERSIHEKEKMKKTEKLVKAKKARESYFKEQKKP